MEPNLSKKYALLLIVFLTIPSLRAIFKYIPYPELASVGFFVFCIFFYFYLIKHGNSTQLVKRFLNWHPLSYVLIFIYGVLAYVIYPIADARKNIGKGSSGDDAMIEPALTLLTDDKLYSVILYDTAPISAGPGWIIQNAPFALLNVYWLLTAFYVMVAVILFRFMYGRYRETNMALLLMSTSLIFWELLVTGHDLIAIGFSFVIFVLLTFRLSIRESGDEGLLLGLAIAVGVFSTSRVVFICFPVLLSIFLWKFSKKKSLFFLLPSLFVAGALHGYFYITSDFYQPLHLFTRGSNQVGTYLSILGLTGALVALIVVYMKLENTIESWLYSVFVCLSIPLATISAGEFISSGFQFSLWEGANYLVPAMPILVFYVAIKACSEKRRITA